MKLSDYSKKIGVTYRTAWNMFKGWDIEGAYQLPSGTIIVPDGKVVDDQPIYTSVYARLHGKRRSRRGTEKLIKGLNEDN